MIKKALQTMMFAIIMPMMAWAQSNEVSNTALLNVQVDALDASLDYNRTRIYVRSVSFEGFSTEGTADLNNEWIKSNPSSHWFNIADGEITIYDGREDGKEGQGDAVATNEKPTGLNPLIVQSKPYITSMVNGHYSSFSSDPNEPGVTSSLVNLFNSTVADAPVYVIPTQESLKITVVYDIEVADDNLIMNLSDGVTRGEHIQNIIAKTITLSDGSAVVLESGKRYTVKLHLGQTFVKVDAEVSDFSDVPDVERGTIYNPFTPEEAKEFVASMPADQVTNKDYYVKGKVINVREEFGTKYGNCTFNISDDGTDKDGQFLIYRTYYLGNVPYSDESWAKLQTGDEVIVCGKLVNYRGTTPETAPNKSYIYSLNGQVWPEPYVVFSENNESGYTMTFYYDEQRIEREGIAITPYTVVYSNTDNSCHVEGRAWEEYAPNITKAVFDPSFDNNTTLTNMDGWFCQCNNLRTIEGLEYVHTDRVTNMYGLFWGCSSLTALDVSHFNTSNVTTMCGMFNSCVSLTTLDVASFNTSKVVDMQGMFYECSSLTTLDLSHFDISSVKYLNSMFRESFALRTIYVGEGWNMRSVTHHSNMFLNCTSLVGGQGTSYNASHVDGLYAHVDGGVDNPGYFTDRVATVVSPLAQKGNTGTYYTLDGRQLQGTPMHKGLFIKEGRKFVVK